MRPMLVVGDIMVVALSADGVPSLPPLRPTKPLAVVVFLLPSAREQQMAMPMQGCPLDNIYLLN